ncbi:SNARE associated Golgi protein [Artemisia annua]|uniref:SNARE associated Golgi protein n=1 Tax=Artemisia annua TaxID=35608 RepID=A0A2U1KCF2_ARTAN|nr:SNARE associated Golgi protein [Artemisia annua]
MAYEEDDAVSCLKITIQDEVMSKGDYGTFSQPENGLAVTTSYSCSSFWHWAKFVFAATFGAALGLCFLFWIAPLLINKGVIPILKWETETFSKPVLAVLIFTSVALFPSILLPSTPSMWVAGMTFGYAYGFLLIIGGVVIGTSLPYFIGSLFYHKIEEMLERFPKKASILRLAGEGNWFDQFKAVILLRISPFPYILYNYCAVATGVKFGPYLFGTLVGMLPEIFVTIYTGVMISSLADASNDDRRMSTPQIVCTVVGFLLTVVTTAGVTVYTKRRLSKSRDEDEPLLQ